MLKQNYYAHKEKNMGKVFVASLEVITSKKNWKINKILLDYTVEQTVKELHLFG